jgi:SAM-dependent methyltransferase
MDQAEIHSRMESLPIWHYEFDLNGVVTPARYDFSANRHRQRIAYFFDPLVEITQQLKGKRVLDLGCNAGFWSLQAIEAGAEFVYGIDFRKGHIDQANLVFEAKGIAPDRYRFVAGDLFDLDTAANGPFDVVLCLGLLYHVSNPVELFEMISAVNSDILLVDTKVCTLPGSVFETVHEAIDDPRNSVEHELVLVPTRRAVIDLAHEFGYEAVVLQIKNVTDFVGMRDYRDGKRAAFMCSKETPLTPLEAGPLDLTLHGWQSTLRRQLNEIDMRLHRRRSLKGVG